MGDQEDPEDLDVVVGGHGNVLRTAVAEWSSAWWGEVEVNQNAFGGYRLATPTGPIDIWQATCTSGILKKRVADSKLFRAVSKSAALSFDSLVLTSNGVLYERHFFDTLSTGILRLNHCSLDRASKVAEKAVRLCLRFRLTPDVAAQQVIVDSLGVDVLDQLFATRAIERARS